MKKILIVLIAITGFLAAEAQQGLHIGVKGGPQSTWMFNQ